jgi:hypothetical protein
MQNAGGVGMHVPGKSGSKILRTPWPPESGRTASRHPTPSSPCISSSQLSSHLQTPEHSISCRAPQQKAQHSMHFAPPAFKPSKRPCTRPCGRTVILCPAQSRWCNTFPVQERSLSSSGTTPGTLPRPFPKIPLSASTHPSPAASSFSKAPG